MRLTDISAEFIARRQPSGLFLGDGEVLACAVDAVRLYAGWACLSDPIAAVDRESIDGETDISPGEWGVIGPLFALFVERETALIHEASQVVGSTSVGRSSGEVASDIQVYEQQLPKLAYVEPVFSVGLDLEA